jgi:hypothetical protein
VRLPAGLLGRPGSLRLPAGLLGRPGSLRLPIDLLGSACIRSPVHSRLPFPSGPPGLNGSGIQAAARPACCRDPRVDPAPKPPRRGRELPNLEGH